MAKNAIEFLSSLSNDLVGRYGIQNIIVIIYGVRKVIAKHSMLDSMLDKIDIIYHKVKGVINLFKPLVDRGVPFFGKKRDLYCLRMIIWGN